jgi:predicted PurR-regulated permease PerM
MGLLTGLLMFIPYLGFALALVLALVAGMLQFGPLEGLWRIALIYALGQAIESWWLTPKLVGERIGLHPVTVIVALLIFGALFGFFGVLLALPFAAAAIVIMRRLKVAWQRSSYFLRPGGTDS